MSRPAHRVAPENALPRHWRWVPLGSLGEIEWSTPPATKPTRGIEAAWCKGGRVVSSQIWLAQAHAERERRVRELLEAALKVMDEGWR